MTSKRFAPDEFNALMDKIDTFMGDEISLVSIIQAVASPAINRHEADEVALGMVLMSTTRTVRPRADAPRGSGAGAACRWIRSAR